MLERMLRAVAQTLVRLRQLLLALLTCGLLGVGIELALLEHYEDAPMFVPFASLAVGLAAVALHAATGTAATVRVLQAAMAMLILSGIVGIGLHYRGSLEFQIDMDPTLSAGALFWKVMHMKAPPTLAPGIMVQLGLLGLAATYRHPAVDSATRSLATGEHT